jgi:TonB family protein
MIDTLITSPWTRVVGLTLLHFLWQGAAIGAGAALVLAGLRTASASVRYVVACVALTTMVLTPAMTLAVLARAPRATPPVTDTTAADRSAATPALAGAPLNLERHRPSPVGRMLPLVTFAWAVGVLALTIRLGLGWWQVQRVRRAAVAGVDDVLREATRVIAAQLGIARPVHIAQSGLVDVPTLVGWVRPAILMPASALAQLSPWQLEAIVTHELAHVRRHDYLVNALQNLVETLLFFHPAVWWLSNRLRLEREHCCDDMVVGLCGKPLAYARALATLEESRQSPLAFSLAATGGSLLSRVQRLVGAPSPTPRRPSLALVLCAIGLMTGAVVSSRTETRAETMPSASVGPAPVVPPAPPAPPRVRVADPAAPAPKGSVGAALLRNTQSDEQVVLGFEEQFRLAKLQNDVEALGRLLNDAFSETNQNGNTRNKPQFVELFTSFPIQSLISNPESVKVSGNVATVSGTMVEVNAGVDRMLFTRTWTRGSDGSWTLLASSQFRDPRAASVPGTQKLSEAVVVSPRQPEAQRVLEAPQPTSAVSLTFKPEDGTSSPAPGAGTGSAPGPVTAPIKIKDVRPVYPAEAKEARVQGLVILTATITEEGYVVNPRVLRSVPMLDQAALDAVTQWVYRPGTLNGRPITTTLTITVNFVQPNPVPDPSN